MDEQTLIPLSPVADAAEKEMGRFLCTVGEVFGPDAVQRAGDLWLLLLEEEAFDAIPDAIFRRVTTRALVQLTIDATAKYPKSDWSKQ
jgi:hypothetical protein